MMAKRKRPHPPAPAEPAVQEIKIEDLLREGRIVDKAGPSAYANYAQFAIFGTEAILDFYQIGPVPGLGDGMPQLAHVQRIIVPPSMLKGVATALANVVDRHEKKTGDKIQMMRERAEGEEIVIWEE